MKKDNSNEYNSKSIGDLPFPLNVQKRIGMYLGSKDIKGKMHTIEEIVANSIDEFNADKELGGYGKKINISIKDIIIKNKKYTSIFVKDRGRGIPIDYHERSKQPALTYILTNLHVGGKIDNNAEQSSYVTSGGLNGIGASAVMAVSRFFQVTVIRDGRVVRQNFEFGYQTNEMHDITPQEYDPFTEKKEFLIVENFEDKEDLEKIKKENPTKYVIERGTEISYVTWDKEDEEDYDALFDADLEWDIEELKTRFHEHAYLNKGLKVIFELESEKYKSEENKFVFYEKEGVKQYLFDKIFKEENKDKIILEPIHFAGYIDNGYPKIIKNSDNKEILNPKYKFLIIDLSFGFGIFKNKITKHFVNNLPMNEGGSQDRGLKTGILRVLNNFIKEEKIFKDFDNNKLHTEDLANVLNFILSIKIENPDFKGQTKNELSNTEAQTLMREFISGNDKKEGQFKKWVDEHKEDVKKLIKIIDNVRKEKKKQENNFDKILLEKLSSESQTANAQKLSDCRLKDKEITEIFICEGDSAAGPIRNSRNNNYQALLPMKGKVLKAWDNDDIKKLALNNEIGSIITSLGCGWHHGIDVSKCKYSKIIILSDADDDGFHITSLLITLFYKYFSELVKAGMVYIGVSPLYEAKKDKEKIYIYNIEELSNFAFEKGRELYPNKSDKELLSLVNEEINSNKSTLFGWSLKRNKGLGEMNPVDMWNSTLDPNKRRLIQMKYIGDVDEFELINTYMSGNKEFIEKRAKLFSKHNFNQS